MLRCSRCKVEKSPSEFYPNRKEKRGYGSWCRACMREYYNTQRAHRIVNGRCLHHNAPLVEGRSRCHQCEAVYRESNLRKHYGITSAQYEAMLAEQGGVCRICKAPSSTRVGGGDQRVRRLAVDHDHATGRVRGLLCSNCNHALGKAKDSPERLLAMAAYLHPEPEYIGAGC